MAANSAAINPKGGNKIVLAEVEQNAGVWELVTPVEGTTGMDLGHLSQSSFDTASSEESLKNEALETVYTSVTNTPVTEGILMQRGKALQDFLRYATVGKFYLQYHYQGIAGGKWQEEFSIGQVVSQRNNSFPTGATTFRYKFNKIVPDLATTFVALDLTGLETAHGFTIRTTGSVIIPAGREDVLMETAVV